MASLILTPVLTDDDGFTFPTSRSTTTRTFPPISILPIPNTSTTSSISSSSSSSDVISPPEQSSVSQASRSSNPAVPIGLVIGIVFGLLLVVALAFFLVRRHFVRKRASSGRITPAKARLANAGFFHFSWGGSGSGANNNGGDRATAALPYTKRRNNLNLNISAPTNFSHLESGAAAFSDPYVPMRVPSRSTIADSSVPPSEEGHAGSMLGRTPSDRMKQKYTELLTLESGLGSHMETMKNSHRKPPPSLDQ